MTTEALNDGQSRMQGAVEALDRDLNGIRTGRANPALVDSINVEYGGATYPVNQLAQVSVPDARMLVIQPWDPSSISAIEKSIQSSDLGITPGNDGKLIRLPIPPLTEERRKDLVRSVRKRVEEGKVAVRNVRRDAQDKIRRMQKASEISEDELRRAQDQLQKHTDAAIESMDQASKRKEEEVLSV